MPSESGAVQPQKPRHRVARRRLVARRILGTFNRRLGRIAGVGTFGLPDIYQEGNTLLDFVYQYSFRENGKWALRFDAENLGDNRYRWTQADLPQRAYQTGRTYQVGLSYSFF